MDLSYMWIVLSVLFIAWKVWSMRRSSDQMTEIQLAVDAGAALLDVRSPAEFAGGHLVGARNVPVGQVRGVADDLKGQTVVVYCASGMRSAKAARALRSVGIEVLDLGTYRNGQSLRLGGEGST